MTLPIIISTYNRFELLQQTLDSLQKNSDSDLEIVVIDDASTDVRVYDYLDSQKDIIYYRFERQVNIATVKNKGIELSTRQKYICMVDNDVYFMPHWDTVLIKVLETFSDIGIVGGKKHPHHNVLESRKMDNIEVMITDNQPGYCLLLERENLDKIGEMICATNGFYGHEDTILCEKIRNMGKLVVAVNPPVIYHCGVRNNVGYAADYSEMMNFANLHPEIKFL